MIFPRPAATLIAGFRYAAPVRDTQHGSSGSCDPGPVLHAVPSRVPVFPDFIILIIGIIESLSAKFSELCLCCSPMVHPIKFLPINDLTIDKACL